MEIRLGIFGNRRRQALTQLTNGQTKVRAELKISSFFVGDFSFSCSTSITQRTPSPCSFGSTATANHNPARAFAVQSSRRVGRPWCCAIDSYSQSEAGLNPFRTGGLSFFSRPSIFRSMTFNSS